MSKYSPDTVYAVAYFDRSQNYYYLKRFTAEQGEKMQSFLDEDADLVAVTSCPGAVLVLTFQGHRLRVRRRRSTWTVSSA